MQDHERLSTRLEALNKHKTKANNGKVAQQLPQYTESEHIKQTVTQNSATLACSKRAASVTVFLQYSKFSSLFISQSQICVSSLLTRQVLFPTLHAYDSWGVGEGDKRTVQNKNKLEFIIFIFF